MQLNPHPITEQLLRETAEALGDYRADGRKDILYDGRTHGNYLDSYSSEAGWPKYFDSLLSADPTGLSIGALLYEMIEATIGGSKVELARVLREQGFVDRLQSILDVRAKLHQAVDPPLRALMASVDDALAKTSPDLGNCTTLEVAICLRDAVHCIEQGLTMRWIQCSPDASPASPVPLGMQIQRHADIRRFVEALRLSLPFGAHLACIGRSHTAVGVKMPGRVAYLSSLSLTSKGGISQDHGDNWTIKEDLDLDGPQLRYPEWTVATHNGTSLESVKPRAGLDTIDQLPRDRLMWFAMLVVIASQRMVDADPTTVELAEALALALPAPQGADAVAANGAKVPAVITPNWKTKELDLDLAVKELRLSPWEIRFLAPALAGRTVEDFLPSDGVDMLIPAEGGPAEIYPAGDYLDDRARDGVRINAISLAWVGTRTETEAVRWNLLLENLVGYLFNWGNRRFKAELKAATPWLQEQMERALPGLLAGDGVHFTEGAGSLPRGVNLYRQSPKHVTFKPLCYFGAARGRPKEPTHTATIKPRDSEHLVSMLSLDGEDALPEFLRGWQSTGYWTTRDPHDEPVRSEDRPVSSWVQWTFSDRHRGDRVEARVVFNIANVPEAVQAKVLGQQKPDRRPAKSKPFLDW